MRSWWLSLAPTDRWLAAFALLIVALSVVAGWYLLSESLLW